jgi:hypothetical protein
VANSPRQARGASSRCSLLGLKTVSAAGSWRGLLTGLVQIAKSFIDNPVGWIGTPGQ